MKKTLVMTGIALFLIVTLAFAQSKTEPTPTRPADSGAMTCSMMGRMAHAHGEPMNGQMQHPMADMDSGMAGMISLSPEEISTLLKGRKADLGLNDAQVKLVADLIASSQQKKADEKIHQMHQMMAQKQDEGMKCPCMGMHEK